MELSAQDLKLIAQSQRSQYSDSFGRMLLAMLPLAVFEWSRDSWRAAPVWVWVVLAVLAIGLSLCWMFVAHRKNLQAERLSALMTKLVESNPEWKAEYEAAREPPALAEVRRFDRIIEKHRRVVEKASVKQPLPQ